MQSRLQRYAMIEAFEKPATMPHTDKAISMMVRPKPAASALLIRMRGWSMASVIAIVSLLAPAADAAKKPIKPAKKDAKKALPAKKAEPTPTDTAATPVAGPVAEPAATPTVDGANTDAAKADAPKSDAAKAEPAKTEPAKPKSEAKKVETPSNFDFDLLDKPAQTALDPEAAARLESMVNTRRTMLQLHFGLGLALVVASTASSVLGTLHYYDKYGGGGYKETWRYPHLVSTMATSGIFAAQGVLAVFAPEPYEREGQWDTARVHRILEIAATVGMVTQIVLGFVTAYTPGLKGTLTERDLARVHLGVGWATWAFTNAGAAAYLF